MSINLSVNHGGTLYDARIVTASKVSIRHDDHGFMPFIETECVTLPGLAFGHRCEYLGPWLKGFTETIGSSSWEGVLGKTFIVLFEDHIAKGVASADGSRIMVWQDFFADLGELV